MSTQVFRLQCLYVLLRIYSLKCQQIIIMVLIFQFNKNFDETKIFYCPSVFPNYYRSDINVTFTINAKEIGF